MDKELIALICMATVIIIGIIATAVVLWKATAAAGNLEPAIVSRLIGDGNALRLLTVLLVISAATFLGLSHKLDESLATLLAGIAGFVLGGMRRSENASQSGPRQD